MAAGGSPPATKRRIAWLYSPLNKGTNVNTVGKRLRKTRNGDFVLGKFDVVVDTPDDDTSNLSEGMG